MVRIVQVLALARVTHLPSPKAGDGTESNAPILTDGVSCFNHRMKQRSLIECEANCSPIQETIMRRNNSNAAPAIANGESISTIQAMSEHSGPEVESGELVAILTSLQTMRDGDFSVRLPGSWVGLQGKIADTFNEIVAANQQMAEELRRVGQVVGKEGKTRERTRFHEHRGSWGTMETSVNTLVDDLLRPTTEVTRAIAAVAQGNLAQTVRLDVDGRPLEGEFLRSAEIVNTMIQQLSVFTAEVMLGVMYTISRGKSGGLILNCKHCSHVERVNEFDDRLGK